MYPEGISVPWWYGLVIFKVVFPSSFDSRHLDSLNIVEIFCGKRLLMHNLCFWNLTVGEFG